MKVRPLTLVSFYSSQTQFDKSLPSYLKVVLDLVGDAAVELNTSLVGGSASGGLELGLEGRLDHLNGDLLLLSFLADLFGNNGGLRLLEGSADLL